MLQAATICATLERPVLGDTMPGKLVLAAEIGCDTLLADLAEDVVVDVDDFCGAGNCAANWDDAAAVFAEVTRGDGAAEPVDEAGVDGVVGASIPLNARRKTKKTKCRRIAQLR